MSMRAHGMRVAVLAGLWLFVTTAVTAQSLKDFEIRGVGDGTRVVLDVDDAVLHKSFTLKNPDRVVLDLTGVHAHAPVSKRSVPGGPVKSVRVAQFATAPEPVTRVVADLRQPSTFRVERVGGKLVLVVTPKGAPSVARATREEPGSSAQRSAEAQKLATLAPKSSESAAPSQQPRAAESKTETSATTTSVKIAPPESAARGAADLASTKVAPQPPAPENVPKAPIMQPAPAPEMASAKPAPQAAASSPRPVAGVTPGRTTSTTATLPGSVGKSKPQSTTSHRATGTNRWGSDVLAMREDRAPDPQPIVMQERPGRRVNLDLQGADIRTVLRTLADYSGVNIIASKEVQGEVSARIKDAPWRHALDSILKAHGYGAVEENGIIRVGVLEKIRLEDLEEKAAERKRDELLPIVTSVVRLQFASADELQQSLREMNSNRGKIQVDSRTNSLIVSDIRDRVDQIATMAQELDGRTPQVEIVSKLVDVSADDAQNLGIKWTAANLEAGDFTGSAEVNVPNVSPAGAIRVGTVQDWGELDFMLDMLARQRRANIVSNPNITTVDNREAKILVGSKIPLIVADEAGNAITQLTTVGIQMRVTPHVNSDETITLDMHPEVSELSQQATVQGGVIINTSEADTRVIVEDGQTAVIGGLIRNIDSEIKTGIPILMDIPGLGWMFRNSNKSRDKRELIIFVTPRLIASDMSLGDAEPDGGGNEDSR